MIAPTPAPPYYVVIFTARRYRVRVCRVERDYGFDRLVRDA
ncbi:MAG: hypothetical protein ACLGHO_11715 [Gammaproteobacteria bacterium]